MSIASIGALGATERLSRNFRLCTDCHLEFHAGLTDGERCSRCGGPAADGCGLHAVVDEKKVCLDCWWPTHLTDAPAESHQVVDTIEQKVRETRELLDGIDYTIKSGAVTSEEQPKVRQALRFHAALLLVEAERLNAKLPAEGEQLLRRYLGEPPWPSWREIMIEMNPEAKAMREAEGGRG